MKTRKQDKAARREAAAVPAAPPKQWPWWCALAVALALGVAVYSPALNGPFVLDDLYLPFGRAEAAALPLQAWLAQRPLLMLTFLWNYRNSGVEPFSYHLWNVLFHAGTAALAFVFLRRLLAWAGEGVERRNWIAAIGAAVVLLHPIHTEAVAYVASRSDVLSTLFCYGALVTWASRRDALDWGRVAATTFLFLCGVATKEPVAVLPALFLLGDYFWRPGFAWRGIVSNWKLHLPLAGGAVLGTIWIASRLRLADTAGFGVAGITWYHYAFTQCRAVWRYLRLWLIPVGFNVDPDFPVSKTLTDHGAVFGLAAIVAVSVAAFIWRKRYPLAAFGLAAFAVLLAPTSSVVPILDPVAERRMYLPAIGLACVLAEGVRRLPLARGALVGIFAGLVVVLGALTYARAAVWGSAIALWEDAVRGSPHKQRPRFQLAFAYYTAQRCPEAVREFEKAASLAVPDTRLLIDWALALDCDAKLADALAKLRQASAIENSAHVQALIGMIHGKQNNAQEALAALAIAEKLDPAFSMTYVYRGNVLAQQGHWPAASAEFQKALRIDSSNQAAAAGLRLAMSQPATAPPGNR